MKKTWLKMTGLCALCAMAATSAQAQVTINIGTDPGRVPANEVNQFIDRTNAQFTSALNDTSEIRPFITGSFSALPSGNPGSGVVFDVNASSSLSFRVGPAKAGVSGGANNGDIDNSAGAGPLEWVSFELTNIRGLGAGDQLVITEIGLGGLGGGESHRLDIGSFGVAPVSADVVGARTTLAIGSDAFSLGAGSAGTTVFFLASITVDVITGPGVAVSIDENFTAAEDYTDGALNGPWVGLFPIHENSFTIDTSGTGSLLVSDLANFHTITHTTSLGFNDSYTLGMDFSFNRASADITDSGNTLFDLILSDGSAGVSFGLMRRNSPELEPGLGNQYRLSSNSSSNLSPQQFQSSDWFNETLLGFADAADNVSDQLRMEATVNRGATATDWTATFVIRNLTTDTEVLAWNRNGSFFLNDMAVLSAAIQSDEPAADLQVSNRVIDRFFASSSSNPDPFAAWAASFGLSGDDALATADPDNDGLTNFDEFAFGLIPNSGASVNPIAAPLDHTTGKFSYTRRTTSGLTYSVWFSESLAGWTEDTGATEGTPVPSGDNETVEITLSTLPGDPLPAKLFIQVRAED